jgi:hypothetical protein
LLLTHGKPPGSALTGGRSGGKASMSGCYRRR